MDWNRLGKSVFFCSFLIIVFCLTGFRSQAQLRGAFIVDNYFVNDDLQEDEAEEFGMELSITRSLDDGYYYFTNEWVAAGSYSTGVTWNWEEIDSDISLDFDISSDYESIRIQQFKWRYENSYDKNKGEATVLFIEFMDGCEHFFTCEVRLKSEDLVLRYEGYREE